MRFSRISTNISHLLNKIRRTEAISYPENNANITTFRVSIEYDCSSRLQMIQRIPLEVCRRVNGR